MVCAMFEVALHAGMNGRLSNCIVLIARRKRGRVRGETGKRDIGLSEDASP